MKTFKVEKLYRNHASLRDYMVEECILKGEGIVIEYQDEKMTLSAEDLKQQFQFHRTSFQSHYNAGQSYQLVDFMFLPDVLPSEEV